MQVLLNGGQDMFLLSNSCVCAAQGGMPPQTLKNLFEDAN